MPITLTQTGGLGPLDPADPLRKQAETVGVLDPDQVYVMLVCQTGPGEHNADGVPDDRVRPSHAALHGTVWRLDDPRAPIPPLDYGCRCSLVHCAAPGTAAAKVLPDVAPSPPVTSPAVPFRDWLDEHAPAWKQVQSVMEQGDPAEATARGYQKARDLKIDDPREVVRMVNQVLRDPPEPVVPGGTAPVPPSPAAPAPAIPATPSPAPPPVVTAAPRPMPEPKQPAQVKLEGRPLRKPTAAPPYAIQPAPSAPPQVAVAERLIARRSTERILIWNKDGKLVGDNEGIKGEVDVPKGMPADSIITHNHPSGQTYPEGSAKAWGSSLSPADLEVAAYTNASEIRAVSPSGLTFVMRRPSKGWPTVLEMRKIVQEIDQKTQSAMINEFMRGRITVDVAEATHFHIVNQAVADRIGATYTWGMYD